MSPVKEYTAKVDAKKRITLRNVVYEYFHVEEYADGRILLEPRELTVPDSISKNTLDMIDESMENLKKGNVSPAIDLSKFEE